jgi:hypothetical protein
MKVTIMVFLNGRKRASKQEGFHLCYCCVWLQNQFQCLYSFYFYLYNCVESERILETSLNILTFVSSTHRWRLKIYESLWRKCNRRLQRWKERMKPYHKWKVVSVRGCSSWKIYRSCTSVAWKRCATMFSTSSFASLSCPIIPFVVFLSVHAFHHVLGYVNMELSSLFFILCNMCYLRIMTSTQKKMHTKSLLFLV